MSSANDRRGAKIAFGELLYSTTAAKSATFAVGGRADDAVPNFPALPGLQVTGISGIDAKESLSLPLSKECGALFFDDKKSPRSVVDTRLGREVVVIPPQSHECKNTDWSAAVVDLAEHAIKKMGAVRVDDDDPPIMVCAMELLILRPNSCTLNSDLYRRNSDNCNGKEFATLLVQLPSVFAEELAVEHGDAQIIFGMGGDRGVASSCAAQYSCHYVCHYSECTSRSVLDWGDQVGGGYRAVLVYHLEWAGSPMSIPRPPPKMGQDDLNLALEKVDEADRRCFVIPLTSPYSERELRSGFFGLSGLSQRDMSIVTAIELAGYENKMNYKFRMGIFGSCTSSGGGSNNFTHQRPCEPTWFDAGGDIVRDEPILQKIDWNIYSRGGHVISKEPLWISTMLESDDEEPLSDKLPVVLVAYDDTSPKQKKARC